MTAAAFRVAIVTLFPEMFAGITQHGVVGRAFKLGQAQCWFVNPRDYAADKHRTVDDKPYGGGPGMLMKVQPLREAIAAAKLHLPTAKVVYLSPQGQPLTQAVVASAVAQQELILVCGRYEGIDERLLATDIDEEWSLGDFVLSGGEIAAMAVMDACVRTVPDVLGSGDSAATDTFSEGLFDYPQYTRPEVLAGQRVPEVLLSGDHQKIDAWRQQQALGKTWLKRPDLLAAMQLTDKQQALLAEFRRENGLTDDV